MAIPTFVAAGSIAAIQSGTALSVSMPAGIQTGDFIVVMVTSNGQRSFISPGTPWTTMSSTAQSAMSRGTYYTIYDGGTLTFSISATVNPSSTVGHFGRAYAFRGVDSATPYESLAGGGIGTGTTVTRQAVTSTAADRLAVALIAVDSATTWASGMPEASWTQVGRSSTTVASDHFLVCGTIAAICRKSASVPRSTAETFSCGMCWDAVRKRPGSARA